MLLWPALIVSRHQTLAGIAGQGAERMPLSPAPQRRLGDPARRRQRRIACPDAGCSSTTCGRYSAEWFSNDAVDDAGASQRTGAPLVGAARRMVCKHRTGSATGHAGNSAGQRVCVDRSDRPTQRTPRPRCWPSCNRWLARIRGRSGERPGRRHARLSGNFRPCSTKRRRGPSSATCSIRKYPRCRWSIWESSGRSPLAPTAICKSSSRRPIADARPPK